MEFAYSLWRCECIERSWNSRTVRAIKTYRHQVFLPQKDFILLSKSEHHIWKVALLRLIKVMFQNLEVLYLEPVLREIIHRKLLNDKTFRFNSISVISSIRIFAEIVRVVHEKSRLFFFLRSIPRGKLILIEVLFVEHLSLLLFILFFHYKLVLVVNIQGVGSLLQTNNQSSIFSNFLLNDVSDFNHFMSVCQYFFSFLVRINHETRINHESRAFFVPNAHKAISWNCEKISNRAYVEIPNIKL